MSNIFKFVKVNEYEGMLKVKNWMWAVCPEGHYHKVVVRLWPRFPDRLALGHQYVHTIPETPEDWANTDHTGYCLKPGSRFLCDWSFWGSLNIQTPHSAPVSVASSHFCFPLADGWLACWSSAVPVFKIVLLICIPVLHLFQSFFGFPPIHHAVLFFILLFL